MAEGSRAAGILDTAASMYPAYVILGGILAVLRPESYHWFVSRGPTTYSLALGAIMMVMGLTLRVEDLMEVIAKRPIAVGLMLNDCFDAMQTVHKTGCNKNVFYTENQDLQLSHSPKIVYLSYIVPCNCIRQY